MSPGLEDLLDRVRVPAVVTDNLNSIPGTHSGGGKKRADTSKLSSDHTCALVCAPPPIHKHEHTNNKYNNFFQSPKSDSEPTSFGLVTLSLISVVFFKKQLPGSGSTHF